MKTASASLSLRQAAVLMGFLAFAQSAVSHAAQEGQWMLRGGFSYIQPQTENGLLTAGPIDVDSQSGPSINVAYFFTPNWAIDVLGALPFKHDFSIDGAAAGSTRHLPPTVTLQHHFFPNAAIRPFAGVGLNYTIFMRERLNSGDSLDLRDSFGLAAQLGFDVPIDRHWSVGFDARYIDIDSKARVNGQNIGTVRIDPMVYSLNIGYRF